MLIILTSADNHMRTFNYIRTLPRELHGVPLRLVQKLVALGPPRNSLALHCNDQWRGSWCAGPVTTAIGMLGALRAAGLNGNGDGCQDAGRDDSLRTRGLLGRRRFPRLRLPGRMIEYLLITHAPAPPG